MRELVNAYREARAAGRDLSICRLVETRGSTPQKAGATMLVFADGSQAGTLGGGCVEAEVKRRALGALEAGAAEIATFQLDSDYGWDDGLICGGRMQVLIDPLRSAQPTPVTSYYDAVIEMAARGSGLVEVIAYDAEKAKLPAPSRFLFDGNQQFVGAAPTVSRVPDAIADALADAKPRPSAQHGVAVLPLRPRCRLVIVGGGHVGQAVALWAADLDFDVVVVDDRPDFVTPERFPRAEQRLFGDLDRILPAVEITPDTYCLIVTRGHQHDERALALLIDRGARYVGLIGSKRKIKLIFDDLAGEGVSHELLAGVFAPVGVDIGSQTVPEIAISILAELVAHRNLEGHVPGRPAPILAEPRA